MRTIKPQIILVLLCVLIFCCKRETSLEGLFPGNGTDTTGSDTTVIPPDTTDLPNLDTPATFTMHTGVDGSCSNALVQGSYVSGVDLDLSHTVTLEVQVTMAGEWEIHTNTVNGMFFANAGIFTSTGLHTVTLLGTGTPGEFGNAIIPVTAGNSTCGFTVMVSEN